MVMPSSWTNEFVHPEVAVLVADVIPAMMTSVALVVVTEPEFAVVLDPDELTELTASRGFEVAMYRYA
jgi:hypothetical protein